MTKSCYTCLHLSAGLGSEACSDCSMANGLHGWEPREEFLFTEEPKKPCMSNERFTALVEELRKKSLDTLLQKNANYANEDRIHNFRVGAALIGGTPAQAALGYMAKHLASLIDKVKTDNFSDREDLLEKCQDIINYICFIWVCGNE